MSRSCVRSGSDHPFGKHEARRGKTRDLPPHRFSWLATVTDAASCEAAHLVAEPPTHDRDTKPQTTVGLPGADLIASAKASAVRRSFSEGGRSARHFEM
jgi:hypothetical protein